MKTEVLPFSKWWCILKTVNDYAHLAGLTTGDTSALLGRVFVCTPGYDETDTHFFVVTKATPKTITLTQCGAFQDENGFFLPDPSTLIHGGLVLRNRLPRWSPWGIDVRYDNYWGAYLWNGQPYSPNDVVCTVVHLNH